MHIYTDNSQTNAKKEPMSIKFLMTHGEEIYRRKKK